MGAADGDGLFTGRNISVIALVVLLVASAWFCYSNYRQSSGAALRAELLENRGTKPKKANPKKDAAKQYYQMIDGLDLTPQQRAKIDATRNLPTDKAGWIERKKVLEETLTDEQMKQLGQNAAARGKNDFEEKIKGMSEEDKAAIRKRFEDAKRGGGDKGGKDAKGGGK